MLYIDICFFITLIKLKDSVMDARLRKKLRHNLTRLITLTLFSFSASHVSAAEKITIFAASSLTNVMTEIGQNFADNHFENNTPRIQPVFSFASSSTLARQIAQGAPAQIYLSANQKWMDYLIKQQAVAPQSKVTLLRNSLVLIAPKSSTVNKIELTPQWDLSAIIGDSRMAVGDPDHVPAGSYARQALEYLQLWQQAAPLLARANNARGALALVERGEAPLGIVYATDALVAKKVKTLATFPANSHQPIEYPLVLINKNPSAAVDAFYQYLQGSEAKAVFVKHGFEVN
ncbi:MAG: molybdate transport system substrate-binding protein [Moritella sp.]